MSEAEKYYIWHDLTWQEKEWLIGFFKEMDKSETFNNLKETI